MWRSIVFWLSFPFVIFQALKIKKNAPRFDDAPGDFDGLIGDGTQLKILGLGDSIIAGVGTTHIKHSWFGQTIKNISEKTNHQIQWQRKAKTGARLKQINKMFLPEIKQSYDVIIISTGVNDVTGLTKVKDWKQQLNTMIQTLKQSSPNACIAFSALPPMGEFPLLPQPLRYVLGLRSRILDSALQQVISEHKNVIHLPIDIDQDPENFSKDGYHPSDYGCKKWGEATAEIVIKCLDLS